ncbi:LytR/AlgR family response regulator transcription factor [Bacteroidota bacterium]
MLKAIVVDDESLARSDLIAVLNKTNKIEIIGETDNIKSAKELLNKYTPDIIFLDIQMPGESGFDLLPDIDINTHIVFVTAFDQYAIRAFEINALDYLLKPAKEERINLMLDKLQNNKSEIQASRKQFNKEDSVFVKLTNSYHFIRINTIIKIEAADDYSKVFLQDDKNFLVLKSMKEWENRLPESNFLRIHRSTLINIEMVEKIEPWFNNSFKVYLKNIGDPVMMSRRYFAKIKDLLG